MTKNRILGLLALVLVVVVGATSAMGQSSTTGNLTGKVENENAGLPGVTITIKSPNLQGTRTTVTSANGGFTFQALPPGEYTVDLHAPGLRVPHEDGQGDGGPAVRPRREHDALGRPGERRRHGEVRHRLDDDAGLDDDHERPREHPAEHAHDRPGLAARLGRHPGREPRQRPHDRRRADVRQPLHGRRRRHHGQHPRDAEQPLRRGRDPGDDHERERDLGRVRPVPGRRHQHGDEVRRQLVLGLVPDDARRTTRGARCRPRRRRASRTCTSATRRPSAGRSGRTTSGSSAPTAPRRRARPRRPSRTRR